MNLESQLTQAILIATEAHEGQCDKGGKPYILHPLHVMHNVETIEEKIVAVLHDVMEDTDITANALSESGIDDYLVNTLNLLNHDKSELYETYIKRIRDSGNKTAIKVKIADLEHNSDTSRLTSMGQSDVNRLAKYNYSKNILIGIVV